MWREVWGLGYTYIYIYIDIRQNNRIETLGATEILELLITPLSLRRNKSTDG